MCPCSLLEGSATSGHTRFGTNTEKKKFLLQKALKFWGLSSHNTELVLTHLKLDKLKPVSHRLSSWSFLNESWTEHKGNFPYFTPFLHSDVTERCFASSLKARHIKLSAYPCTQNSMLCFLSFFSP